MYITMCIACICRYVCSASESVYCNMCLYVCVCLYVYVCVCVRMHVCVVCIVCTCVPCTVMCAYKHMTEEWAV